MAVDICREPKFKRKQKVVAVEDLPGVPAGTAGKVFYEAGVRWFRYHVRFENEVELANVDGNALVTVDQWAERQREARLAELAAEREARAAEAVIRPAPGTH